MTRYTRRYTVTAELNAVFGVAVYGSYMRCSAYNDHGGGTMICNRCGYQWDADDPDPPPCKTWDKIKQDQKRTGNNALKHIREDLDK